MVMAKKEYHKRLDPLSHYTDNKFLARYRLPKNIVRKLIKEFVPRQRKKILNGKQAVSHSLRFCVALRYFATGANYSLIADVHGVSITTVHRAVSDVADFFRNNIQQYVHWPKTFIERANAAVKFLKNMKKGRIFGLIDGTHIPIACPWDDEQPYYCRKGYYSLNAMIVCDNDGMITHVDTAYPGSCNDIYVLNGSQVSKLGEKGEFAPFFLLGDSGYPQRDYLLTPYKREDTPQRVAYNKWHRKTRSQVERTIGILKQRWRCLDTSGGYLFHSPYRAGSIVEACVCLHNVARSGDVKIYKDFPAKDNFRIVQKRVVQPKHKAREPTILLQTVRDKYCEDNFKVTQNRNK